MACECQDPMQYVAFLLHAANHRSKASTMVHRIAIILLSGILLLSMEVDGSISLPKSSVNARNNEIVHRTRGGAAATTKKNLASVQKTKEQQISSAGTATITNEIVNLLKCLVGSGVLGLPSGIAACANSPKAILPVSLLVLVVGIMSGYCFSLIGRICTYTDSQSYQEAWSNSVSPKTAWMPAFACLLVTLGSVVAFSMILSDTLPSLFQAYMGVTISRTQALLGVTVFPVLPLCLLKDLSSLAPFSALGTAGMLFTAISMCIRYFQGSYALPDGKFLQYIENKPSFGNEASIWNPNVFLLLSMLSSALLCHYIAPKFMIELKDSSVARFNKVVVPSFAVAIVIFIVFGAMGFLTFGESSSGLVLNDYATQDTFNEHESTRRGCVHVFGYPLAFVGVRDGVMEICNIKSRSDSTVNTLTVVLLTIVTVLAFYVKNLRTVLALGGATWGNYVVYLFPTYMFCKLADTKMPSLKKEKPIAVATGLIGLVMGIVGTINTIQTMNS